MAWPSGARRRVWSGGAIVFAFLVGCSTLPSAPLQVVHYSGRVIDSKGLPLSGGYLSFEAVGRPATLVQDRAYAEVDSEGGFRVDLYASSYDVMWGPPYGTGVYHDSERPQRRVDVSQEHATLDWIVDGVVVRVHVADPSGAIVDTAAVYGWNERFDAWVETTSGDGTLYLAPGIYQLGVSPRPGLGLPSQHFGPFAVSADTTLDLQIQGIEVSGIARGPGSTALGGAVIEAYAESQYPIVVARCDAAGAYRMYLMSGDYRFMIRPVEEWILPRLTPRTTIAAAGTLDFDLAGAEWTGVVTRSDTGMPVSEAVVRADLIADTFGRYARATTDAAGQFRVVVEPGREFDLYAAVNALQSPKLSRVAGADSSFALEIAVPTP